MSETLINLIDITNYNAAVDWCTDRYFEWCEMNITWYTVSTAVAVSDDKLLNATFVFSDARAATQFKLMGF